MPVAKKRFREPIANPHARRASISIFHFKMNRNTPDLPSSFANRRRSKHTRKSNYLQKRRNSRYIAAPQKPSNHLRTSVFGSKIETKLLNVIEGSARRQRRKSLNKSINGQKSNKKIEKGSKKDEEIDIILNYFKGSYKKIEEIITNYIAKKLTRHSDLK